MLIDVIVIMSQLTLLTLGYLTNSVQNETTSALYNVSEARILEEIEKLCTKGTTVIAISTLKNADMIMVLEDGIVRETGIYEVLSANNGIFKHA